jgi:hypothetical protein
MKQGKIVMEFLIMGILVVFTSAIMLVLIQTGVLSVKADSDVQVIQTEFLIQREGSMVIKEFEFCGAVDESYTCLDPKINFQMGDAIHFRFVVETSTSNGEVMAVENYRLRDPLGKILLEVEEEYDLAIRQASNKRSDSITFKDYFIVEDEASGQYTLDLVIENPLIGKRATLREEFNIQ